MPAATSTLCPPSVHKTLPAASSYKYNVPAITYQKCVVSAASSESSKHTTHHHFIKYTVPSTAPDVDNVCCVWCPSQAPKVHCALHHLSKYTVSAASTQMLCPLPTSKVCCAHRQLPTFIKPIAIFQSTLPIASSQNVLCPSPVLQVDTARCQLLKCEVPIISHHSTPFPLPTSKIHYARHPIANFKEIKRLI